MGSGRTRVLIVDDTPGFAQSLALLLAEHGYETDYAHSAPEALQRLQHRPSDCVMVDARMPGVNGIDLARQLRERFGADLVLVGMSGGDAADPDVDELYGLVDYLFAKPIDMARLSRVFPSRDEPVAGG